MVTEELGRVLEEVLSQYLPGGIEENHKEPQSG